MKIMVTLLIFMGQLAFADSTALLQYTVNQGLFGNFLTKTISVERSGEVTLELEQRGDSKKEILAVLSKGTVERLEAQIEKLDETAPLIDDNPNRPPMKDSGSSEMLVLKNGVMVTIQKNRGGHKFDMQYGVASSLVNVLTGLSALSR